MEPYPVQPPRDNLSDAYVGLRSGFVEVTPPSPERSEVGVRYPLRRGATRYQEPVRAQ